VCPPVPRHIIHCKPAVLRAERLNWSLAGDLGPMPRASRRILHIVVPLTWADDPSSILRVALGVPGTFEESAGFGAASELTEAA